LAKFVSRQRGFRVFLKMEESGGKWADFGDRGECEVKDPEDAEKLRNAPNLGRDFYEVGHGEEKPKVAIESVESGDLYKCPVCGITESKKGLPFDTAVKVILHARMKHKKHYTTKDIEKIEEVKVA